jgi:hypothetical protein
MISVICLEWLRHRWFSISLFLNFDSLYCSVTSSLTLWEFSYTRFMLTWNVKLLLCSLDLVACIIIALSYILLLVCLDLFTMCGVHRSYYTCFLCGLICSPLVECTGQIILAYCAAWFVRRFVSQCFGYDPCMFCHGVHLQYRCDFQLASFYPCFEMSCCGCPHFSYCGWQVGFACDYWWLFLLLWLLCLGHMHFDLLYCLSGLCLPWGLSKLVW